MTILNLRLHPGRSQDAIADKTLEEVSDQHSADFEELFLFLEGEQLAFYFLNLCVFLQNIFIKVMTSFFLYEPLVEIKFLHIAFILLPVTPEDSLHNFLRFAFLLHEDHQLMHNIWENVPHSILIFLRLGF